MAEAWRFLAKSMWSFGQNLLYLCQVSGLGTGESWDEILTLVFVIGTINPPNWGKFSITNTTLVGVLTKSQHLYFLSIMFLLVTEDVRMIGGNIGCDILLAVVKKLFFFHLLAKFCQRSETAGGIGDSVKVYHIDRDISFGNRHSKMSEPKDFLQKFCKSSHWCSTLPCGTRVVLSLPLASEPGCHQWGTTSWWRWTFGDLASISGLASDPSWLWYNHAMFCFPYQL